MVKGIESREQEPKTTLAYLGPSGTFTELAAVMLNGQERYTNTALIECKSISDICTLVAQGGANYGVVPFENSTAGDVKDTMKALSELELQIRDELVVPISQSLFMQRPESVRTIATKDQAYYQSRDRVSKLFPNHTFTPVDSTALGIQMAANDPTIAGIGARHAADALNLSSRLQQIDKVEDNPFNVTTFVVIRKPGEMSPMTDHDKSTFIVSLIDAPGSLYHYLDVLQAWGINLNKIRSHGKVHGHTTFLISIDGHKNDPRVQKATYYNPSRESAPPKMLGSYRKADYEPPEMDGVPNIEHAVNQIRLEMQNGSSPNKQVVIFTLNDEPGALANALGPFARRQINLTAIDSMPTRRKLGEYMFYLAFDRTEADTDSAVQDLAKYCTQIVLL